MQGEGGLQPPEHHQARGRRARGCTTQEKAPAPSASHEAASLGKKRRKIKLPICAGALDPIKAAAGGGRGGGPDAHKVLPS